MLGEPLKTVVTVEDWLHVAGVAQTRYHLALFLPARYA